MINKLDVGNIIFTYFCVIFSNIFKLNIKNIQFNTNNFVDLLPYNLEYEEILNFYILNLLVFIMPLVEMVAVSWQWKVMEPV